MFDRIQRIICTINYELLLQTVSAISKTKRKDKFAIMSGKNLQTTTKHNRENNCESNTKNYCLLSTIR